MRIRPALPDDLEDLLRLMQRVYHSFGEMPPAEDALREFLVTHLEKPDRMRFIVAEYEDELVGLVSVGFCPTTLGLASFAWIDDFHVLGRVRGRGIGKALLRFACDFARDEGALEAKLTAATTDARLARLYREAGFKPSTLPLYVLPLDVPPEGAA